MNATPPPVHGPPPDPDPRPRSTAGARGSLVKPGRPRLVSPRLWGLWGEPWRVVVYVLTVDIAAAVLAVGSVVVVSFHRSDVLLGLPLLVVTMLYIEATGPIERLRERRASVPHVDLNSTWMVSAALLLHPVLVAVVVAVIYLQRWVRIRHHVPFRQAFSAAAAILSAYAAMAVLTIGSHLLDLPRFADAPRNAAATGVVLAAGATFVIVNMVLIAVAIALSEPDASLADVLPGWEGETLELATVGLAVLVAWALADWPAAVLLIFFVSYVLHDKVLFPQLRRAANTDSMTGLLNHGAWSSAATLEILEADQAGGSCFVLVVDLDEFKQVNDRYGHLVGDSLLIAVSMAIATALRGSDVVGRRTGDELVGRYGGEEFIILLPGKSQEAASVVAERVRRRISDCAIVTTDAVVKVTASIGVAIYPDHGSDLNAVVSAADQAMYAAKKAGRDQVRFYSGSSG